MARMVSRVVRKCVFAAVIDVTLIKAQQREIWLLFVRQQRRAECFRVRTYTGSRQLGKERILRARERRTANIESEERAAAAKDEDWELASGVIAPTAYY